MNALKHLIYSSAATRSFSETDLAELLLKARQKNRSLGVTGMLLHVDGSFLQVLEGPPDVVDAVFRDICADLRHTQIVTIITEPIPRRAFTAWSMGCASLSSAELGQVEGANDFFTTGSCFAQLGSGRARKLLGAFKDGRWRSRVSLAAGSLASPSVAVRREPALINRPPVSFAFQPVLDAASGRIVSHEAIMRSVTGEAPDAALVQDRSVQELTRLDTETRVLALGLAARLGLTGGLSLAFKARQVDLAPQALASTVEAARQCGIDLDGLTLVVDQDGLSGDPQRFHDVLQESRGTGLRICIDHFGTGRSGLVQLDVCQPDAIALDETLIRDIEGHGPRQAIVRGIIQSCRDLGIDVLARHVASPGEYRWLRDEGVTLFQGPLIGAARFEQFTSQIDPDLDGVIRA